jgi:hypothetical protein
VKDSVESKLHWFLKKVGVAFLLNQGCFMVDTEVSLSRFGQRRLGDLDARHVIDVCGVGERLREVRGLPHGEERGLYEAGENILRGVEVKVSRSDFRSGFVCTGCNYNYLLTPMRLVAPWEVPQGVGLIEYNKHKFSVEPTDEDRLAFTGLRVVRKASFRSIGRIQVDNAVAGIARRSRTSEMTKAYRAILKETGIAIGVTQ